MADEKDSGNAILGLVASLTSPAKLAFAGYVLLVYFEKIERPRALAFAAVAVAFIVIQIIHDDYLRILLNREANRGAILWWVLGTGFVVVLLLAVVIFSSTRSNVPPQPRPWNAAAVSAQPLGGILREESMTLQYRLTNRTDTDFRVHIKTDTGSAVNVFQNDERGLTPFVGFIDVSNLSATELPAEPLPAGVEPISFADAMTPTELFVPARSAVGLKVDSRFDRKASQYQNLDELRRIHFAGFVIQDSSSRIRIDLPFVETSLAGSFPHPPPPAVVRNPDRPPN